MDLRLRRRERVDPTSSDSIASRLRSDPDFRWRVELAAHAQHAPSRAVLVCGSWCPKPMHVGNCEGFSKRAHHHPDGKCMYDELQFWEWLLWLEEEHPILLGQAAANCTHVLIRELTLGVVTMGDIIKVQEKFPKIKAEMCEYLVNFAFNEKEVL